MTDTGSSGGEEKDLVLIDPQARAAPKEPTSADPAPPLPAARPPGPRPRASQTRRTLPSFIDALLRAPTLDDLFEILPPRVGEYLHCRRIVLYIVQDDALQLVGCTADATTQGWSSTLIRLAPVEPIALHGSAPEARALRSEHPVFEPATANIPARIIMPLHAMGGPVGALVAIPSEDEFAWGGDGLRASHLFLLGMEDLARVAAIVLQDRMLFLDNRRRATQMDLLQRLTTAFNSSVLDMDAAVLIVERQLSQVTRANFAAVALGPVGPTGPQLTTQARWLRPDLLKALLQQRSAVPIILDDLDHWQFAYLLPEEITSFYAFPLVAEDRVAGFLALAYRDRHSLTEGEQHLIAILANSASSVLIKSRLYAEAEQARQQSRTLLERVQREERLKDGILRNILSGLLVVDTQGRVMHLNPSGAAMLGCSEHQALGAPVEEVMALVQPGPHLVRTNIGPRMAPHRAEVRVRAGTGQEVTLALTITPLRLTDGKELGVICAFQDITEIRALQEQAQKLEKSSRDVSHDMRNVAHAMLGGLEYLTPQLEGNPEARKFLNILHRDTGRLVSLAENLMSLGRPRPPQVAICDASELIETVLHTVDHAAQVAHVRIERRLEPGATLLADEHQIMRVLENLCNNAIEAMPKGGVLTLTTRSTRSAPPVTQPEGAGVAAGSAPATLDPRTAFPVLQTDLLLLETRQRAMEIEIADTGTGIPAERLSDIWEPFKTFGKRNGHGLGLAIVRQIVEAHGGTIHVASTIGQGTSFTLRLPTGRAERGGT